MSGCFPSSRIRFVKLTSSERQFRTRVTSDRCIKTAVDVVVDQRPIAESVALVQRSTARSSCDYAYAQSTRGARLQEEGE